MDENERQTRRELLAEAWDKADEESEDVAVVEEKENESSVHGAGADADEAAAQDKGEDSSGEPRRSGVKKDEEVGKKPAADETQRKEAQAATRENQQQESTAKQQPASDRPPQSWKPSARESWGKIPAEARAEINRRELEIQRTLSQTDGIRRFANDFAQVVNPFAHLIRAQNSTPLQAVRNLMTTAAGLMQGNAYQKAAIISEICQNYGVDFKVLDDYLAENWDVKSNRLKGANGGQRMEAPPSWAAPLFGMMQNIEQQQQLVQQRVQQEASEKISAAESKPFFDDLRDDIADIMEIAANRGIAMTIDQAYEKALKLNDEVSKIVEQRKRAEETKKNNKNITRARRAASTISGSPSGKVVGSRSGEKQTRRQMLSEAWDNAE